MSAALNSLVKVYLDAAHPRVAKTLASEAPLDEGQRRKVYGRRSLEAVILQHATQRLPAADSSDDESTAPIRKAAKASPKVAPRKAPIPDSSDDDDAPVVKRSDAKRVSPKTSPRLAAKKGPAPDSSASDDEPVVRKPAAKKASPKVAAAKTIDSSDSDDDAPPVKRPAPAAKRPAPGSDDEPVAVKNGASAAPAHKAARVEGGGGAHKGPANRNPDGTYKRFQRIDPTKVAFTNDALRDNRPGQEHLVLRQNQEMMRVKGKDFNKLKQKNKGKFYGAGVDLTVRSFQFPDSDDE